MAFNSKYTGEQVESILDSALINTPKLASILIFAGFFATPSVVTNPEWQFVLLDGDNKVLIGVRVDNSLYVGPDLDLDEILASVTSFASSGTFANAPSSPLVGQRYFCTDKQTTEGARNGIPIWHNGTNWVDALGRIVS